MAEYDFLIVGAGMFGAVFAHEASACGKRCLVIDKRSHIGGNCYTEKIAGINVHKYGAHIFRTAKPEIWHYMQRFCEFNNFINSPIANYHGELYNMPFNMNTFYQMWGVKTPAEAMQRIESQRSIINGHPKNLEEQAISLVGEDIYRKLIQGYTEKQWGKSCKDLPASIIRRLPLRFTFDNNYFNDPYQGIPIGGYTAIFEKLLAGSDVKLAVEYLENRSSLYNIADNIIYTGTIDSYFDYKFGSLEYRSLRFDTKLLDTSNYQGVAVMNFTDIETPYTRIIEHKHFEFGQQLNTVISYEYPLDYQISSEPYYPIEDPLNQTCYRQYAELASQQTKVHFGGRLGEYKYYDMQDTIISALQLTNKLLI